MYTQNKISFVNDYVKNLARGRKFSKSVGITPMEKGCRCKN